ncbi:hypothetical protein AR543_p0089 (plasmid) [Paenibacillus bovis]|uniref:DUF3841 domain-containing protein n=1 Tax=Paenibacillus bovis TaxID=1616788 RepID=A0A1X9T411_9BACL|nr:hypothetical protein AR543_p0089 [Paenibacillus bovis]
MKVIETYWTIQSEEVWELAVRRGYLIGDPHYYMFPEEYEWMIQQMRNRLPGYIGEPPIWLWLQKPDMRSTGHAESGSKIVRLTVQLDPRSVLVSDCWDWEIVLNNGFNADTEAESQAFDAGELQLTKEQSWERIFELDRPRDSSWIGSHPRILQGTTGRIDLQYIRKVEYFTARQLGRYLKSKKETEVWHF